MADLRHREPYQSLRHEIKACDQAHAESLRRLARNATHLHDEVSLGHFYALLVPFERLSNRILRDDEFIVIEGDGQCKQVERVQLKVVVENLRSAFNVGALFRTSECLGVSEIIVCGYTPGPDDEKTMKTAMGTDSLVPWRRVDRAPSVCEELKSEGYRIIALETEARAISLYELEFDSVPTAFVLGNERFGLDSDTLNSVDSICRIPVRGLKNSMNVGVAFGIAAFEWLRQYEGVRS
jgi:tRNA G18 (ribose-2'-O)-methylase SpoU